MKITRFTIKDLPIIEIPLNNDVELAKGTPLASKANPRFVPVI